MIRKLGLIECDLALLLLCSSRNNMWETYGGWMRSSYAVSHKLYLRILPKLAYMLLECAQVCEFQPELWSCKQRAVCFTTLIPDSPLPLGPSVAVTTALLACGDLWLASWRHRDAARVWAESGVWLHNIQDYKVWRSGVGGHFCCRVRKVVNARSSVVSLLEETLTCCCSVD